MQETLVSIIACSRKTCKQSIETKPEPVGPIKSTLLFSSSTLSSSSSLASEIPDSATNLVLQIHNEGVTFRLAVS